MQIDLLEDPVGYLAGMVGNFVSYRYDPGTSKVRFGTTGTGKAPNYKIESPSFLHPLNVRDRTFEMTVTPAHTFHGRSHREMVELDQCYRNDEHWSADTMTFAELKALLFEVAQTKTIH
jgi:hypothetical protein